MGKKGEHVMKRYMLIWEDEEGLHEINDNNIEVLLGELQQCLEIDIEHNQLCNYKVEVKEV